MGEWSRLETLMRTSCELFCGILCDIGGSDVRCSLDVLSLSSDQQTLSVFLWSHGESPCVIRESSAYARVQ
jgi:hypothetical protein